MISIRLAIALAVLLASIIVKDVSGSFRKTHTRRRASSNGISRSRRLASSSSSSKGKGKGSSSSSSKGKGSSSSSSKGKPSRLANPGRAAPPPPPPPPPPPVEDVPPLPPAVNTTTMDEAMPVNTTTTQDEIANIEEALENLDNELAASLVEDLIQGLDTVLEEVEEEVEEEEPSSTIVDLAVATPDLSTLVDLVTAAGLVEVLSGEGPFTVFAPTNAAFEAVPAETLDALAADVDLLTGVLTYHVVPGLIMSTDLVEGAEVTAVSGGTLTVTSLTPPTINESEVVLADVMASNGVVHVIGAVLIPPAEPSPTPSPTPSPSSTIDPSDTSESSDETSPPGDDDEAGDDIISVSPQERALDENEEIEIDQRNLYNIPILETKDAS